MRRATLLLFPLLAACGGDEGAQIETADLTGLYHGEGEGEQRDRTCVVTDPSGFVWFGIVTMGPGRAACSGIGQVEHNGDAVRLAMAGDEECDISARMEGTHLVFPATVPDSCAYYCSPGATLAGKRFEKTGDTAEAAMQAADLVGDPLCS